MDAALLGILHTCSLFSLFAFSLDLVMHKSGSFRFNSKNANAEPDVIERVHDVRFASGSGFERRTPCKFIGMPRVTI